MKPGQKLFNFLSKSELISHSIGKWTDEDFQEYHEFYAEREAAAIEEFGLKWRPVTEDSPTDEDEDYDGEILFLSEHESLHLDYARYKENYDFFLTHKDLPPVPKEEKKQDFEMWWEKEGSLIYKDAAKNMAKQIWQTATSKPN